MFNEVINITCIDILFCFTDVIEQQYKHYIGFVFIGTLASSISVHLYFIGKSVIKDFKKACTKKIAISSFKKKRQRGVCGLIWKIFYKTCCKCCLDKYLRIENKYLLEQRYDDNKRALAYISSALKKENENAYKDPF